MPLQNQLNESMAVNGRPEEHIEIGNAPVEINPVMITHDYQGTGREYARARNGAPEFVRFMVEKSGLVELAKSMSEQPVAIVEFGVGSGQQTIHLEEELVNSGINNYSILALDKSSSQLAVLKDRIERGEISKRVSPVHYDFDGRDLLVPTGEIDLSYMALVIHHLTNKAEVINEIARTSKQGAKLFIYSAALEDLKDYVLNEFFPKYEFDARRCPTYEEMKELFEQAGFVYKGPHQIKINGLRPLDAEFLLSVENKTIDSVLHMIEKENPDAFREGVEKLRSVIEQSEKTGKYRQITTYPTTVFWGIKS